MKALLVALMLALGGGHVGVVTGASPSGFTTVERQTHAVTATSGLGGKLLLPRDIAGALRSYWSNYELTKGIATALSESAGYVGAWHDNTGAFGTVVSRDCGLMQISIQAKYIGTDLEASLRTASLVPVVYSLAIVHNVQAAVNLYYQPWTRNGGSDIRRWQPWVGYTSGWATFPAWWIWHQENGLPVGPWVRTGRYIQRAIIGQVNRHVIVIGDWTPRKAYVHAVGYAQHFGINPGLLYVTDRGTVAFHVPAAPTAPPADGIGPRPTPNSGL